MTTQAAPTLTPFDHAIARAIAAHQQKKLTDAQAREQHLKDVLEAGCSAVRAAMGDWYTALTPDGDESRLTARLKKVEYGPGYVVTVEGFSFEGIPGEASVAVENARFDEFFRLYLPDPLGRAGWTFWKDQITFKRIENGRQVRSSAAAFAPVPSEMWGALFVEARQAAQKYADELAKRAVEQRLAEFNGAAYRLHYELPEDELEQAAAEFRAAFPDRAAEVDDLLALARARIADQKAAAEEYKRGIAEAEEANRRYEEQRAAKAAQAAQLKAEFRPFTAYRITLALVADSELQTETVYSLERDAYEWGWWRIVCDGVLTPTRIANVVKVEQITVAYGDEACRAICKRHWLDGQNVYALPAGLLSSGG